tara:strand:- start:971 stop:1165 length:195 start_codon:yes stop_codon:yes gene_type:complete
MHDYFSNSSTKQVWLVLKSLQKLNENHSNSLKITWFIESDDDEMREKGEEFEQILKMKFDCILK